MALKSVGYNCRKWTVFTLCLVNIIAIIAVVILVIVVSSIVIEEVKGQTTIQNNMSLNTFWKILKTVLIVSVVVIVLVHIFGLITTWKEHFYLSAAYSVFTAILGVVYIVAKFHIAPIFILMFVLDVPLSILSFVYSYDIYKRRNASNQLTIISMATLEQGYPSSLSQNNTFPNYNQTLPNQIYPDQIYSDQDYPVQLHAGQFIEQNSAMQPMGYLPPGCQPHCEPPPYSEEDYHNENYPNLKYTVPIEKGQFIGQTAHSHMQTMGYLPSGGESPPFNSREKMSPIVN